MAQPFDYLCVLDFEATCIDGGAPDPQEIIEFPIVLLNTLTLQVEAEFHRYVKPQAHPTLSPFCVALTGIQQEWVDAGVPFPEVMREVDEWLRAHHLSLKDDGQSFSFAFVTCGDWDLKTMLPKQCAYSSVPSPPYFEAWVNIKRHFEAHTHNRNARGMVSMLAALGLPLEGRHHSGIDDARNISKLSAVLIRDGCAVTLTKGRLPGYTPFHHPSRVAALAALPPPSAAAAPHCVPPPRGKQRLQNGAAGPGVAPGRPARRKPPPPAAPAPAAPGAAPRLVVHCMKAPWDVYIGRPNPQVKVAPEDCVWGNPFTIGKDGERADVIRKYREWLLGQPEIVAKARSELCGKILGSFRSSRSPQPNLCEARPHTVGCWCAPQPCHGDVLAALANGPPPGAAGATETTAPAPAVPGAPSSPDTVPVLKAEVPKLVEAVVDIGLNLTHRSFAGIVPDVVRRATVANCQHMILSGTSLKVTRAALQLARQYPGLMTCTAGVHPHEAKDAEPNLTTALAELLEDPLVVAVGECGLDFRRTFSPPAVQERVFEDQVRLAVARQRPLFCHECEAHDRFLDVLRRCDADFPKVCVHCFTGTEAQLQAYVALGCYVGVTGFLCHPARGKGLRSFLAKHLPLSRLMVETDAPFMPLPGIRNRNEPCFLPLVVQTVAQCYGVGLEEVARVTTANARRFFRLPAVASSATDVPGPSS